MLHVKINTMAPWVHKTTHCEPNQQTERKQQYNSFYEREVHARNLHESSELSKTFEHLS